jgi:hypothetical protein
MLKCVVAQIAEHAQAAKGAVFAGISRSYRWYRHGGNQGAHPVCACVATGRTNLFIKEEAGLYVTVITLCGTKDHSRIVGIARSSD